MLEAKATLAMIPPPVHLRGGARVRACARRLPDSAAFARAPRRAQALGCIEEAYIVQNFRPVVSTSVRASAAFFIT
jgi:hypothetical protein